MSFQKTWQLRAEFARQLSEMYGTEVPAYTTLVEVSEAVNSDFLAREGGDAERLGSIDRVTAERHGAIRVGSPEEMSQVATVFAAFGMYRWGSTICGMPLHPQSPWCPLPSVPWRQKNSPAIHSGCSPQCWPPMTPGSSPGNSRTD